MKAKLATALILVAGCGGGSKKTATPAGDTGGDSAAVGDSGSVDPAAAEVKEPPAPPPPPDTGGFALVKPDALTWTPLMEGGPEMAVVHGDPQTGPSAFFLRVPPGGKAGVHSHTADYQAVVVSGAPKHFLAGGGKKAKALDAGSHWFQPGAQAHDDECTGKEPCVLFIISDGKFDMTAEPKAKAPKVGKYALHARKDAKWAPMDPSQPAGPKLAIVHGDPKVGPVGFLLEVPAGGNAGLHSHTGSYQAVTLDGAAAHWLPHETGEGEALPTGTYWFQPGGYDHGDRCTSDTPCHIFVFNEKALDFKPAAAK
jgi:quercetin dioxygenase-like cupin family protein